MTLADVVLVWPMRTLAAAIRLNGWSESSSLRPSAAGIEPRVKPFYALRVSPPRRIRQIGHRNRENSEESRRALPVCPYPGNHAATAWAASAAATSMPPTQQASSTSQRLSDGERVHLRSDGPGLNVAGALVNGEDYAILGHQTVRHLEGRRHSALAEEAFA